LPSRKLLFKLITVLSFSLAAFAGDTIPKIAWTRPLGLPLENPGHKKNQADTNTMIDDGYWQGAPVGGFGAGTFSRTYRGDFSRWHIKAGVHKYETVWGNQFSMYQKAEGGEPVAQVLTASHPNGGEFSSWKWDYPVGAGDYHALYPKAWYDYKWDKFPAHVVLEQFSPILPNNYKESSYPVAVYQWHAENPTDKTVTVSVMLTWTNMIGWFRDYQRDLSGRLDYGNKNTYVSDKPVSRSPQVKGIVFDRVRSGAVDNDWDGQWAIATAQQPGVEVTHYTTFSNQGAGARKLWAAFAKDGKLPNDDENWVSSVETMLGGIAITFELKPGEKKVVPMVIAWDMPVVEFGGGRKWYRKYTDYFGTSGTNAMTIAREALTNADKWSKEIDDWQAKYINDDSKPDWYRAMLFNEMYILADGGSFWGRPVGAPKTMPAKYSFMECYDYPFYASLDVAFYGSLPMAQFWPEIDKQVMKDFAGTVMQELPDKYIWLWKTFRTGDTVLRTRKNKGYAAHDLGVPQEDPFFMTNQFCWQDTNRWKDLNSKFVLMVYRDFVKSGSKDVAFLRSTWPAVQEAMKFLSQFDVDHDGMIENEGYPDQTYDNWVAHGTSAYTGSLYLAALRASEEIAKQVGAPQAAKSYHATFVQGQKSYIAKLWNGSYFNYDTGSTYKDNVQAEQLAGQWYARITGLGDIVPPEMTRSALKRVFDLTVRKNTNGQIGALNGVAADGSLITYNEQVQEVWGGTTFGLASHMLAEGLRDEAFKTAWGIYNVTWVKKGYWFRTPESWDMDGMFRVSMYMRPAAIWGMEMVSPPQPSTVSGTKASTGAK
jgi:non-lysosomal glucosylceramidase